MTASRKLTRDDWLKAARGVLVRSGIDDVKVDRLAKRLKVTRGSFYWHFEDRQALLDALVDDWRARNVEELGEIRARWTQATPDFAEVIRIWLIEDPTFPQFDMAIRSWARKAPKIATLVHRIDEDWIALLQTMFEGRGVGSDESRVRAKIIYYHQVGYYALDITESLEERVRLVRIYYQVLTGADATPALDAVLSSLPSPTRKRTPPPDSDDGQS